MVTYYMIFFSLILIIGALTTFTDLKNKKIYNRHLSVGAVLGLIAAAYAAVFRHEHVLFHIVNGLAAFLIGLLLHRSALWKGGDAKLFTLYAFLMPPPVYSHPLFTGVVSLFACSFIAGMAILIPVFIKDIIFHHKTIANDLFLPAKRKYLFLGIMRIIFYSWVLFPFYYLARITNPVMILTISYLFFSWKRLKIKRDTLLSFGASGVGRRRGNDSGRSGNDKGNSYGIKQEVKKHYIIKFFEKRSILLSLGFVAGFFMRLLLSPDSLSYPALTQYIILIMLSAGLSICIHTLFNHFKDYHERVSFAPLLFIGCVLSYTPFLTWVIHLHLMRR